MKYIYDIRLIFDFVFSLGARLWELTGLPLWLYSQIKIVVIGSILLGVISLAVMFLIWLERRLSAHFQSRIGPNRVGWQGSLQAVADIVKLLAKENITPANANVVVYLLAPMVVFAAALMAYIALPVAPRLVVNNFSLGILYILSISSLGVIGILMAGWSSNNKYSLIGGMRSAAQMISYEIPLVLAVLSVIMMAGSLNLSEIVASQKNFFDWHIFRQPLAFLIYFVAATAEINRLPFDIPEAESELTAGFHTEYSGIRFGIFFLAEFANMMIVASIVTSLFLGGWHGFGFLPPIAWFLIKDAFTIFTLIWFRWTFPRFRMDQLMNLGWKILTPLALLNIFVTGIRMFIK